ARPSTLPFQLPPFDRIHDTDYLPAFEAGMRAQRDEVTQIAQARNAPTFENTLVALERSGELLERVSSAFSNLNASNTNPQMQRIESEIAPRLQSHEDAIFLDSALYARVDAVYRTRSGLQLDAESAQLLERYHTEFVRAGAQLSETDKQHLRSLNEQLSGLTTRFKQNVLKATQDGAVLVDRVAELDGLSAGQAGAAALAAQARGMPGKWLIPLQNTTNQPLLAQLTNRGLRERIYKASAGRGLGVSSGSGPGADNRGVIAQIVRLRAERAALLGYPNHAAYVLADESAASSAAVHQILGQLVPAALARAKDDARQLQMIIDAEAAVRHTATFALQPWDWEFYAEKLRASRYDFDQSQVKPYFELDHVLQDGVFHAAHELYGLTFKERKDLPVYQPDVRVFEVLDADGSPLALFL